MTTSNKPGLSCIDLFAGCGGLSLGLKEAGWSGIFAIERDPMAFETLSQNFLAPNAPYSSFPEWPVWLEKKNHDIVALLKDESVRAHLRSLRGAVTMMAGGPPCQGFSVGGRRDGADERNSLVYQMLDMVDLVRPRVVLIENVEGIARRFVARPGEASISVADAVIEHLSALGYTSTFDVLDASRFGVPQSRRRVVIVGIQNCSMPSEDLKAAFKDMLGKSAAAVRQHWGLHQTRNVTAREAIDDLTGGVRVICPDSEKFESATYTKAVSAYARAMRRGQKTGATPNSHRFSKHGERIQDLYTLAHKTQPPGRLSKAFLLENDTKKDKKVLIDSTAVVSTITTHPDEFIHYIEPRNITVREMARFQSFPDNFHFHGRYTINGPRRKHDVARCSQVGNAVPPLMAEGIQGDAQAVGGRVKLVARDCSPLVPQPTAAEAHWLRKLATNVRASDLVVPISGERDEDEPIVYCEWDGTWWAGRYVGSISFEGHSLIIEPRFGLAALRNWLFEATSVVLTDAPGKLREDESFIAQLLASVWAHGFVEAARHGLPALRREVATRGATVRGRLDVSASLRLIATGGGQVVSIRSERTLDHAASDAIVAAYEVLRRWLGVPDEKWLPKRAKELLPHLMAVTGARPRVPTKAELDRIRYTPITAGFAPIAELSRQIANRRGLAADIDASGETKGVLLDVAELWEMYVLSILRKAAAPLTVTHGTRDKSATKKLLHSEVSGRGLGTLIPDAILLSGSTIRGVVDAKYKSLHPSANSPNGPQRDDLYQMAAYLGRFQAPVGMETWGLLAYPFDPSKPDTPHAEQNSPWSLDDRKKIGFATLPHDPVDAVAKLRSLVVQVATPTPWVERA